MRDAALYALQAGIRTAAQTAAGLLASVTILDVADLMGSGHSLLVVAAASLLSGVVAFLQNFAEMAAVK